MKSWQSFQTLSEKMAFPHKYATFRAIVAAKKQNVLNAGKIGFNQKRNRRDKQ